MLFPRIIPCLLIRNKGLVKTIKFKNDKYIGDPLTAVKIFNEKEADELIVLDIDASSLNKKPNFKMIENLAMECQMPLCYGGGIKNKDDAIKILELGVEKITLSSSAINNPLLISEISKITGRQSVVVVLDVKKRNFSKKYDIYTMNGKKKTNINIIEFVKKLEDLGCGEIVINSIDNDGIMKGYDFSISRQIRKNISIPMTIIGGAGSLDDLRYAVENFGVIGISAGSLFVFKGPLNAVLINYPEKTTKEALINEGLKKYVANTSKY